MHRDLPESRLSEPVSAWLAGQGFTVWAEVPFRFRSIDLVGWGDQSGNAAGCGRRTGERPRGAAEATGETPVEDTPARRRCHTPNPGPRTPDPGFLVSVELKTALRREGIRQAMLNHVAVDQSWLAVGVVPRSGTNLEACRRWGIGVLICQGDGVAVLIEPGANRYVWTPERLSLMHRLQQLEPGGLAGLPCLAGCGPAQEVARAIAAYRREHPAAGWRQIWRDVPNHYVSARSLQNAMRGRSPQL